MIKQLLPFSGNVFRHSIASIILTLIPSVTAFADQSVDQGVIESAEIRNDFNDGNFNNTNTMPQASFNSEPVPDSQESMSPAPFTSEPVGESIAPEGFAASPAPIKFILDRYFSPITGAYALNSALHGYMMIDDSLIPSSEGVTEFTMVLGRIGKYLLEGILFQWGMVAQHEVFGHGFRAREFHLNPIRYRVTPWSGFTSFGYKFYTLSPSEKIAVSAGGVEGTYILARELRNDWLERNCMDEREAHVYIQNALDQTFYVLSTRNHRRWPWNDDEHDINSYIKLVNKWYGKAVLSGANLRRKILMDFLDPYVFFSIYSIGHYFVDGTQGFEYPMIPLGPYRYLPGFRISLAPYGPEYQFINYLQGCDQIIQATIRYGNNAHRQSYGLILDVRQLWTADQLSIDGRLDLWRQPKLFTQHAWSATNKLGGALSFFARYRVNNCLEFIGQLGYKTMGYMPGEQLKQSAIVRAGFAVHM